MTEGDGGEIFSILEKMNSYPSRGGANSPSLECWGRKGIMPQLLCPIVPHTWYVLYRDFFYQQTFLIVKRFIIFMKIRTSGQFVHKQRKEAKKGKLRGREMERNRKKGTQACNKIFCSKVYLFVKVKNVHFKLLNMRGDIFKSI